MGSFLDLRSCNNVTALSLASVVVNRYEADECSFPISLAFSTILGKPGDREGLVFRTVFHLDPKIYSEHPLYEQFLQQLDSEKENNPEIKFYRGGVAYYGLKDIQEVFKDMVNNVTLGGHYYFKYVFPLIKNYGFLGTLDEAELERMENDAFDTLPLYLFDRYFGFNPSGFKAAEEDGLASSSCKELFTYFSKMNDENNNAVFRGTKLTDLFLELFGTPLVFSDKTSTCIERADAVRKVFCNLVKRMEGVA